jgi:hypothetical protein
MTVQVRRRHAWVVATAAMIAAVPIGADPAAAEPLPVPVGGFQDGIYVPINDIDLTGSGGASVMANGNLALTWAGSRLDPEVAADELESLRSDLGLRGAVTLDLSASTAGDVDDTLEVLTLPLAQFSAGPATVTPFLGVNMHFSGHAEAGAQVSIVAPFNVSAALSGSGGQTSPTARERPSFQPEIGLPDAANAFAFSVSVEVEVTMTFMLSINGFPVGGPVLLAALGTELVMDPISWDLDAFTSLKYGWSLPDVTGAPEPPRRTATLFPRTRWDIPDSNAAPPVATVSTRWSRAFGIDQYDSVGGVVPIGDELAVIEASGSPGGPPWMATLDGLGSPTWQQQGTEHVVMEALTRTAVGDLVAVSGGPRIERFAADGTPRWARQIGIDGAESSTWSSIVPTDQGVIVAGRVRYPGDVERPMLIDIDDAGQVRWISEVDLGPLHTDFYITAVGEAPDGDLLVVGQAWYYPDSAHDNGDALIMRVARDGTVENVVTLGGTHSETITSVAVQPDGSYAIAGDGIRASRENFRALVASFDANDQLLWSSLYLDRPDHELASARALATGITAVGGGDYVVSGTTDSPADAWLMRIDGSGMPVWAKSFIGTENDELTGVVAMPTGVAAFGSTETTDSVATGFDDIWLVRTSVDGMVHFDPASGFHTVNGAAQWSHATDHVLRSIQPVETTPTFTISDTAVGAAPIAAIETLLT